MEHSQFLQPNEAVAQDPNCQLPQSMDNIRMARKPKQVFGQPPWQDHQPQAQTPSGVSAYFGKYVPCTVVQPSHNANAH